MYAIVRKGSSQVRVAKGDVVRLPLINGEVGSEVEFDEVLQVSSENKVVVGKPRVAGAKVRGKILRHGKDKKILVFMFKRRKGFEKRKGHRQGFTEVRIEDISL
jgi:large subunit ribosomal protein L21